MVAIASDFAGGRRRIRYVLVAGGERHIVRLVQVNLERAGYTVYCALNGKDALEYIADDNPDFCIVADTLTDPDGYTVVKQIREHTANVPILMLLRDGSVHSIARAYAAGADRVTVYPFDTTELIALLKM